jgi:hypothetical protein
LLCWKAESVPRRKSRFWSPTVAPPLGPLPLKVPLKVKMPLDSWALEILSGFQTNSPPKRIEPEAV